MTAVQWTDLFINLFVFQVTAAAFLIFGYCLFVMLRHAATCDEERWCIPDPSDAEFLASLSSDSSPEVALRVRRIISSVSGWDVDEISPDTILAEL